MTPDGEVGEMLVRGPSAGDGYWNQRDKSRATFEGNWTRSGDKYVRDAEGYYTYQGRTDDMFKVSGIWVSPFEVESALIGHDSVLEAAVVPKEDTDGLLKPKAFIVLKPGKTVGQRPAGRAERACEGEGGHVEIPALDRDRGRPAQDCDGQDPAVQAAREWLGSTRQFSAPLAPSAPNALKLHRNDTLPLRVIHCESRRTTVRAHGTPRLATHNQKKEHLNELGSR